MVAHSSRPYPDAPESILVVRPACPCTEKSCSRYASGIRPSGGGGFVTGLWNSLQCGFLVLLTALRSFSALTPDGFCISCSKHVDGCIVKGGIRYDLLRHEIMLCQQMHISLVETQNLASPVLPIPIHSFNIPLAITACTPSRDAKSCVSRATHTDLRTQ